MFLNLFVNVSNPVGSSSRRGVLVVGGGLDLDGGQGDDDELMREGDDATEVSKTC